MSSKLRFSVESVRVDFGVLLLRRVEVSGVDLEVFSVLNGRVDHEKQVADALLVVNVQGKKFHQTVVVLKTKTKG